jgi:hypothetical protein
MRDSLFKYTVRSASGKIIGKAMNKEGARNIQRNSLGGKKSYVKSNKDSVNPFREEM